MGAGASLVGKVALIVFPVTGLALYAISLVPMATLSETDYTGTANPSPGILARVAGASWSIEVLGLVAATLIQLRTGVLYLVQAQTATPRHPLQVAAGG